MSIVESRLSLAKSRDKTYKESGQDQAQQKGLQQCTCTRAVVRSASIGGGSGRGTCRRCMPL